MKFNKNQLKLYAVTDRRWTGDKTLYQQVEEALKNGVTMVQLREKELDHDAFLAEAKEIRDLCHQYQVPFIVNDNVKVAIESKADGIHVGQEDMAAKDVRKLVGDQMILGVSAHNVEEAKLAQANGADYLGLGAVFHTDSKADATDMTAEMLKEIVDSTDLPTVAIGGINQNNLMQLKGSGVDGVAVISAIFGAKDIDKATQELSALSDELVDHTMKRVLSIAGSDSSGGAGIQADLKTMLANGVFGMTAITALTAQNTMGVSGVLDSTPEFLQDQIDAVFEDIRPDAVKIGMVSQADLVEVIVDRLKHYQAQNIVVDPVMVATSGSVLSQNSTVQVMKEKLLPIATVITPNIAEAEVLSGLEIKNKSDMEKAAKKIGDELGCAVLCKGGHRVNDANDLLYDHGEYTWFEGERINNSNTHGTGCTLSSAIASNLAKNYDLKESIKRAKDYISGALNAQLNLGHGSGPMNHAFDFGGKFFEEK